jgi:TctA family transporter
LLLSRGSLLIFVTRPISAVLIAATVGLLILAIFSKRKFVEETLDKD